MTPRLGQFSRPNTSARTSRTSLLYGSSNLFGITAFTTRFVPVNGATNTAFTALAVKNVRHSRENGNLDVKG